MIFKIKSKTYGEIEIIIDDDDFGKISHYKWAISVKGKYAVAHISKGRKNQKMIYMHRFLIGAMIGQMVDHKNMNTHDNRKSNLRIVNKSENEKNKNKRSGSCTSKYKGVSFNTEKKMWDAKVSINGKTPYIGRFISEALAAFFYNEIAKIHYGEHFRANEIPPHELENCDLKSIIEKLKNKRPHLFKQIDAK